MRRSRNPGEAHIPDPSATIPDFGPRPELDQKKLDEIRRLIPPPSNAPDMGPPSLQHEAQREPATPPATPVKPAPISAAAQAPVAKPKSRKWLYLGVAAFAAMFAAFVGFVVAAGAGLAAIAYFG